MFAKPRHTRSGISGTLAFLEQVYFGTVRSMRKSSGRNAVLGLIGSMAQTVVFVMAFYFMFQLMGSERRQSRAIICSILSQASPCS